LLAAFGEQLGEAAETDASGRKLKGVHFEYEDDEPKKEPTFHEMAGGDGYSLSSNWFVKRLAQLAIARRVSTSQLAVFLYVVGCQKRDEGITYLTQEQIRDGLNEEAARIGSSKITRNTVNKCIRRLCKLGWLEQVTENGARVNGKIRINPTLWFSGNSRAQQGVLFLLAGGEDPDPAQFPYAIGPTDPDPDDAAVQRRTG
jgi:hypothetical protein